MPQPLLDSLAGQPQLEALDVKWGSYSDLNAVTSLPNLRVLTLGGARSVTDLRPLASLSKLRTLVVDGAFLVTDLTPLSSLGTLRELVYGNCSLGSDKTVEVRDFVWIRPMADLRTLQMPGSRLSGTDLSDLLTLPNLSQLNLPLRRAYKKQVFEFASRSKAFAGLARAYDEYDEMRTG
ncbi:leucine-rich repeat domain-containing protein [Mycetocola zhujimingii]|uniref:leucine-rich repeat domain-containing protein n=1 Tax=Mycetocola zhujimingii TaxID=2079792 RepID=UPI0013C3F0FB|nr:leucine-rich repeat domain-containing protein [Mycetocola zhujimingii]